MCVRLFDGNKKSQKLNLQIISIEIRSTEQIITHTHTN
jgi:hypothetical protein